MKCLRSLALVSAVACHHRPVVQPLPSYGPVRDTLLRIDVSRTDSAKRNGPSATLLAFSDRDVAFQRAGAPTVFGRENMRALFATDSAPSDVHVSWQPLGGALSLDHNSGYTFGITVRADSSRSTPVERYVAFWRRNAGTPWRILAYAEIGGPVAHAKGLALQIPPVFPGASRRMRRLMSELMATDSAFSDLADRQGIATAFASNVAPDGVVFGGPELIIGPRQVRDFFMARPTGNTLTWRPLDGFVAGSEDLGYTVGEYVATGRGPSGAAVQSFGKYIRVWKKQQDGSWKFMVDGGSREAKDQLRE